MYEVKEIKKKKKVQYDPVSGKIKFWYFLFLI